MLPRRSRHVQILPILIAVCRLTLAFPTPTPSASDDVWQLQVNIPSSGPVSASLGGSISIPCLVSLSSSSLVAPRVKWTMVSGGVETQILVARGQRVKVNEAYRDRAAWLNYTSSPDDLSLWLGDLRSSDSGHYRCEVQQGLEDASDIVELKVKGVVFHYRDALGRYAFSFRQAQRACETIGAQITTPDQLLAAYYDGYEQCDAGWLADQSVRYPIQVPREGCYGDMDGQPGVRNYGTMDPEDLFDVYCYVEETDGKVFFDTTPQQLSFDEAESYCRAAGAELATTAQLYLAWSEGLDHCSPGWLSDGSVRYPITDPRDRCGGPLPGVKTLYRFSNQTGFPEPSSLHDVYCFKNNKNTPTDTPMDHVATVSEDIGQDVVILRETERELQLNQHAEQVELKAQRVLESFHFFSSPTTEEHLLDTHPKVVSDTTESPLNTTPILDLLQTLNETSSLTELSSQHPTALVSTTETYDAPQNTSLLSSVYNQTDSHQNLNITFDQSESDSTTGFPESSYETHIHNQTVPDTHPEENKKDSQEIQETNLHFDSSHSNYSETNGNYTQEENFWEVTSETLEPVVQVKLEEAAVENGVQVFLSTQASREEELVAQPEQTTKSPIKDETSLWAHLDGSGDISQESDLYVEAVSFIPTSDSSTSGFTTHQSLPALANSASTESQTARPNLTLSSETLHSDKLGLDILSTVPQTWESPISRQEGSTSLEADDTVTLESVEKQLHTTKSENLVSGVGLTTTESPEGSNNSPFPTDSSATQYQTSSYREYLDTTTTGYEEASGHELATVSATLEEEIQFSPTLAEVSFSLKEATVAQSLEEEASGAPAVEEETYIAPTHIFEEQANNATDLEKEANMSPVLEKEVSVATNLEEESSDVPTLEEKVSPTIEGENVDRTMVEEDIVASTIEEDIVASTIEEDIVASTIEEDNVARTMEKSSVTPAFAEESSVAPTTEEDNVAPAIAEEASVAPTTEEDNITPTIEEEDRFAPTIEENIVTSTIEEDNVNPTIEYNVTPTIEEEGSVVPTIEEEDNVSPTIEEASVGPNIEEEVEDSVAPTIEETSIAPTMGEEADISLTLDEKASIVPTLEEEASIAPTLEEKASIALDLEEETSIALILVEEASIAPTLKEEGTLAPTLGEEASIAPILVEEASIAPTLKEEGTLAPTLEEEASIALIVVEEASIAPTLKEEGTLAPTLEEEASIAPILVEEASIAPILVEEASIASTPEEEGSIASTLEEEASIAPTLEEDFTVFPLDSQTSKWALLTTTTGPQESLNDLEYSRKDSITSTTSPDSSSSTKPTASTTKPTGTTTTTHWSKRTWSPTTSAPKVFHKTAEPQKVPAFIPPVDHGVVDVEFSLTPPPTLLILPNERAAVGGTGKASDACVNDPCLNGGTCTDRDGQIQCLCLPTYGGDFCQTDLERCEPGWDKFHGFCYRHFGQRLSWEVAEKHCRMQGAHLVSIITPEEQSYINNHYKEYQWTGLNDKTIEDDFRWSDGNPLLYENWYRGQPDSYFLSGEDCVVMVWHDDGRWSDVPCNYHLAYTCKKGTSSCGPPPRVRNTSIFGKARQRYETNAVVRYHCAEGFQQRLTPLIRCLPRGEWERPQVLCIPEARSQTNNPEVTSLTNSNFAAAEGEFEATKKTPEYWDIKF